MSRMPRINIENALYFIISKGDRDEDIFREGSDYNMYLELLKKNKEQHKFKLFGYCLTPNQINLLIELSGDATISQIMHGLNSTYTKYFGSKYGRGGHLFQERYKMVLVEKEPNILGMSAYINLLPELLKIHQGPGAYRYSSAASYLYKGSGRRAQPINIESEVAETTGRLKDKTYEEFVSGLKAEDIAKIENELNKKPIIGTPEFIESVKAKVEGEKKKAEESARTGNMLRNKKFLAIGLTAVLALGVLVIYLYVRAIGIKENFKKEIERKDVELNNRLREEKEIIYKGLDEKYRADMVTLDALTKRLEAEKKRAKEGD